MNHNWMNDPSTPGLPGSANQVDPFASSASSIDREAQSAATSTSDALHLKPEEALALRLQAERELAATLHAAAERVRYITGASGVALALCESEADEMVCRGGSGPTAPEVGTRMYIQSGITAESIRTRETLRCDHASADPRVNQETCKALGIESVMVMPLIVGRDVVGIFELFGASPSAFGERDAKTLQGTASGVQFALERAVNSGFVLGHIPWAVIPDPLPEPVQPDEIVGHIHNQIQDQIQAEATLVAPDISSALPAPQASEIDLSSGQHEENTDEITLRTPVVFPITRSAEVEKEGLEISKPEKAEAVPAFLARLADEAKPSSTKRWSQWFRPQW